MRLKPLFYIFLFFFIGQTQAAPNLRIMLSVLPISPDPSQQWNYQQFFLVQGIFDTLVKFSPEGNIISNLAKRWTITESATLYTFELDPKKFFSNGQPVRSNDVALSISGHFWKSKKSTIVDMISQVVLLDKTTENNSIISSIKVLSPTRFSIKLKGPYPPFLNLLTMPGFSVYFQNQTGSFAGSGPFLVQSQDNSKWVLRRKNIERFSNMTPPSLIIEKFNRSAEIQGALNSDKVDLIVGLNPAGLEGINIPPNYHVVSNKSLAFSHFYVNASKPPFDKLKFREAFSSFFKRSILDQAPVDTRFIQRLETFIVPGVMPRDYYKKTASPYPDVLNVLKQEKRKIVIVLRHDYFDSHFLKSVSQAITKYGLNWQIKLIGAEDFMSELEAKKYDVISAAYLASFPDPDGFLSPISRANKLQYGVFDTKKLLDAVTEFKFDTNKKVRLDKYIKIFHEFEGQHLFIPGYRFYLPIIHKKNLIIPDWNFKHEGELWNIVWK